jgi:DNA-binding response OmpR family regulator
VAAVADDFAEPAGTHKLSMNTVLQTSNQTAVAAAAGLPARILVVDDDQDINQLMTAILIRGGYDVDSAKDGISGWEALRTTGYDLLITDNNMPSVTGLELIKRLRSEDLLLPVILTSGLMPTDEINQHPWLQIDAVLAKPFNAEVLLKTVKNVLLATRTAETEIYFPMATETVHDLDAVLVPKSSPSAS